MAFVPSSRRAARRRTSFGERATTARHAVSSAVGRASSALALSPVLRWRYGRLAPDGLVIAPSDLRSVDPTFAIELERGELGVGGQAFFTRPAPWTWAVMSDACFQELHGFGWLRHVSASVNPMAAMEAAELIGSWIARDLVHTDPEAWRIGVAARRTISWLSHGPQILEDADHRAYDVFIEALGRHLMFLRASAGQGADGYPRMLAAIAKLAGDVCFEGRERQLARSAADLARELDRQIEPDGGHVTRNPDVLIGLLIDLLPVVHAVRSRNFDLPPAIAAAISRVMRMIRHLRIGGTRLARFNGGGNAGIEAVAAVLGYDTELEQKSPSPICGDYIRLTGGRVQVVLDAGAPPQVTFAGASHAGALSFELAVGPDLVFVNSGSPAGDSAAVRAAARATASHTTLVLADRSSATLLDNPVLARVADGPPLVMTGRVEGAASATEETATAELSHEGYVEAFGLIHQRRVSVRADGSLVEGQDRLRGPAGAPLRLSHDVPFAVRFHLAHAIDIADGPWPDSVDLRLPDGQVWRFSVSGALLSIEESRRFDAMSGGRSALQIVLRAATFGESEVRWEFAPRPAPPPAFDDLSAAIARVKSEV